MGSSTLGDHHLFQADVCLFKWKYHQSYGLQTIYCVKHGNGKSF